MEGEADAKLYLSETQNLLQDAADIWNCMTALMHLKTISRFHVTVSVNKDTHKIIMYGEKYKKSKDALVCKCKKVPVQVSQIFTCPYYRKLCE